MTLIDVLAARPIPVAIGHQEVLLVRTGDHVCALQRRCPHLGADLAQGTVRDGLLICPKHKAAFDLATGKAADPARLLFLKFRTLDVATYPVQIRDGRILVDTAEADSQSQKDSPKNS